MTDYKLTNMNTGNLESDERGTGARDNGGKVEFHLLPLQVLAGAARILSGGKLKYKEWNWTKGSDYSTAFDCMMRHMTKWWYMGEDCDDETGEHHLSHIICNAMFLLHWIQTYKEGDNRPPVDLTRFNEYMKEFNKPFDKEAYLNRNPKIKERINATKSI